MYTYKYVFIITDSFEVNNYIVRLYRVVIVATNIGKPVKHRLQSHTKIQKNITK